jgi:hypothetical protein
MWRYCREEKKINKTKQNSRKEKKQRATQNKLTEQFQKWKAQHTEQRTLNLCEKAGNQ